MGESWRSYVQNKFGIELIIVKAGLYVKENLLKFYQIVC